MLPDIEAIANHYNPNLHRAVVIEYKHSGTTYVPHYSFNETRKFTKMEMKKINKWIRARHISLKLGDVIRSNYTCLINSKVSPKTACTLYVHDGIRLQKYCCCNVKQIFQVWQLHPTTGVFISSHYWSHVIPWQHVFVNTTKLPRPFIVEERASWIIRNRQELKIYTNYGNIKFHISGLRLVRCKITTDKNRLLFMRTYRSYPADYR